MKILLLFVFFANFAVYSFSATQFDQVEPKEMSLVASADGITIEDATKRALRNAIEQSYGAFVSANTEILNDELISDSIITVSSGNIKSYETLSSAILPDGRYMVTLKVIVSVSNLINYVKSKGAVCEFDGALFVFNEKQKRLNEQNEVIAIQKLLVAVDELFKNGWDYNINVGRVDPNKSNVICKVTAIPNQNALTAINLLQSTLKALSVKQYNPSLIPIAFLKSNTTGIFTRNMQMTGDLQMAGEILYLRNKESLELLKRYFSCEYIKSILNFSIRYNEIESKIKIDCCIFSTEDRYGYSEYIPIIPLNNDINEYKEICSIAASYYIRANSVGVWNPVEKTLKFEYNKLELVKKNNDKLLFFAEKTELNRITNISFYNIICQPELKLDHYPDSGAEVYLQDYKLLNISSGSIIYCFMLPTTNSIIVDMNIPFEELERITEFKVESNI